MEEKIEFTDAIQPICLSKNPKPDAFAGLIADIYGWGIKFKPTESRQLEPKTKILNVVRLPIWSMESCRESYKNASHEDLAPIDSMFCTGDGVRDSCKVSAISKARFIPATTFGNIFFVICRVTVVDQLL